MHELVLRSVWNREVRWRYLAQFVLNQSFIVVYSRLFFVYVDIRSAYKNHTKISNEYVIKKKRRLRGSLRNWRSLVPNHCFIVVYLRFICKCCARHPTHTKISGEYVIKKRWSNVAMHTKISDEYVIKKTLIEEKLSFFLPIFKCLPGLAGD